MSSEYFFGCGRGKVSQALGAKLDKIAKRHTATFTWINLPGEGQRYWFATTSLGAPFDKAVEVAVLADVAAAGLEVP